MITLKEQEILEEICLGSKKIQRDIHAVLGKVYDEELALDLNSQAAAYARMQERAEDTLLDAGVMPATMSFLEKTRRWAEIQSSTALNISTDHIASLIQSSQRESLERLKMAMEGSSVLTSDACELAEEYQRMERQNLEILNAYRG